MVVIRHRQAGAIACHSTSSKWLPFLLELTMGRYEAVTAADLLIRVEQLTRMMLVKKFDAILLR